MYCKNCGKKLPDSARFCDRCNMSVNEKKGKMDIIEDLKEERLARQKAKEIEGRLKNIKRAKRRKYSAVITLVVTVAVLGIGSVVLSYILNSKEESPMVQKAEYAPTATPATSIEPTVEPTPIGAEGFITAKVVGGIFAYPDEFIKDTEDKNNVLSLKNEAGDAKIVVNKIVTRKSSKELMEEYRDSIINAKATDSLANTTGYNITLTADGVTYHKKSFIVDDAELYYEISYPTDSPDAVEYEECIKYMDMTFRAE